MAEPFRIIDEDRATPQPQAKTDLGVDILRLAIGELSKRFVIALSRLFTLLTVASAFLLWWRVLPEPSILQLIGLGMYATFILAANFIVRRQ